MLIADCVAIKSRAKSPNLRAVQWLPQKCKNFQEVAWVPNLFRRSWGSGKLTTSPTRNASFWLRSSRTTYKTTTWLMNGPLLSRGQRLHFPCQWRFGGMHVSVGDEFVNLYERNLFSGSLVYLITSEDCRPLENDWNIPFERWFSGIGYGFRALSQSG